MFMRILLAGLCSTLLAGAPMAAEGEETQGQTEAATEQAEAEPTTQSETKEDANPVVLMETSMGNIELELYPEKAPKTVENFLSYVNDGFFDGTIFHRVIKGFMIQGGGFTPDMDQKTPTYDPIPLESRSGLKNERGTISMARTSVPNSATCQFFINHKDNPNLDYPQPDGNGYAVFGKVLEGMDTVDKIADVKTTSVGPHANVPAEPVVIKSVKVVS